MEFMNIECILIITEAISTSTQSIHINTSITTSIESCVLTILLTYREYDRNRNS